VVGEFDLQEAEEILAAADMLELDAVQVGTFSTQETLQALHEQEVPVIKEVVVQDTGEFGAIAAQLQAQEAWVSYFLLDFQKSGITWPALLKGGLAELKDLAQNYPVLVAMDVDGEQLDAMLEELPVKGISVRGGAEEKVGYKSFDELDELFEAIEVLEG